MVAAVKLERIMSVEYSPLITMTPRTPLASSRNTKTAERVLVVAGHDRLGDEGRDGRRLFVLPGITTILPASTSDAINPYLSLTAGTSLATSTFESSHHLAPWTGFAVFCGYTAVALVAAAVGLLRRDA